MTQPADSDELRADTDGIISMPLKDFWEMQAKLADYESALKFYSRSNPENGGTARAVLEKYKPKEMK